MSGVAVVAGRGRPRVAARLDVHAAPLLRRLAARAGAARPKFAPSRACSINSNNRFSINSNNSYYVNSNNSYYINSNNSFSINACWGGARMCRAAAVRARRRRRRRFFGEPQRSHLPRLGQLLSGPRSCFKHSFTWLASYRGRRGRGGAGLTQSDSSL